MKTVIVHRGSLSVGQNLETCIWYMEDGKIRSGDLVGMVVRGIRREFVPDGWSSTSIFSEIEVELYSEILAPLKAEVEALGYRVESDPEDKFLRVFGRDIPAGEHKRIGDVDDIRRDLSPLAPEFPDESWGIKVRTAEAVRSPSGRGMAVGTGTVSTVPVKAWRTDYGLIAVSSPETGWTARRAEAAVALRLLRRKGINMEMLSLSQRAKRLIDFPVANWRKAMEAREAAIAAFDTAKAVAEVEAWQRGMAAEFGNFASLHAAPGGLDMGPIGPQVCTMRNQAAHAACAAAEHR